MKKLFIAALIVLAAGTTAFATDATKAAPDVTKVSRQQKSNFELLFPHASDVTWEQSEQFLSASFTVDDENFTAFFAKDGELIGTTQNLDLNQLPAKAIKKIRKNYASFKITQAIEFTRDDQSNYYVMVEDGNRKQILEINSFGNVSVFKGKIK